MPACLDPDQAPAGGVSPYAELLSHYVDAVGHASTMPYYSTGFIQCKDRYRNQSQVSRLVTAAAQANTLVDSKHARLVIGATQPPPTPLVTAAAQFFRCCRE